MERYFLREYIGPSFAWFGPVHLALLGITLVLSIWLFFWKPGRRGRFLFRYGSSILLVLSTIGWHWWKIAIDDWTIQEMLPLHLSGILVWLVPVMLITRNRYLFVFSYFAGIPGTLLALLFPELGIYNFPHFRVVSFFIAHILLLLAPIYMIQVERIRPVWKEMWAVFGIMVVYTLLVMGINVLIGSNYLFVNSHPDVSETRLLWRWPWYVLMEALGFLAFMYLLYLPFASRDWISRRFR